MDKISLGVIFIIAAILSLEKIFTLSSIHIFCFSLSALFMSITGFIDDPIDEGTKKMALTKIIKFISYFISIAAIVLFPLLSNTSFFKVLRQGVTDDFILLLSIGLTILTMYFGDLHKKQLKNKYQLDQRKAVLDVKKEIIEKLKETNNNNND